MALLPGPRRRFRASTLDKILVILHSTILKTDYSELQSLEEITTWRCFLA